MDNEALTDCLQFVGGKRLQCPETLFAGLVSTSHGLHATAEPAAQAESQVVMWQNGNGAGRQLCVIHHRARYCVHSGVLLDAFRIAEWTRVDLSREVVQENTSSIHLEASSGVSSLLDGLKSA